MPIVNVAAQTVDTAGLRKDLQKVLNKYGLRSANFELKVSSINQSGGQTAFQISNYTANTMNVVNGDNYGINGNLNLNEEMKLTQSDLEMLLVKIAEIEKTKNVKVANVTVAPQTNSNAPYFGVQILAFLKSRGYKAGPGMIVYDRLVEGVTLDLKDNGDLFIAIGYIRQ